MQPSSFIHLPNARVVLIKYKLMVFPGLFVCLFLRSHTRALQRKGISLSVVCISQFSVSMTKC